MEIKDMIKLMQAVAENGLTSFELEEGDWKLTEPGRTECGRCSRTWFWESGSCRCFRCRTGRERNTERRKRIAGFCRNRRVCG